jgi:hypothetical protein
VGTNILKEQKASIFSTDRSIFCPKGGGSRFFKRHWCLATKVFGITHQMTVILTPWVLGFLNSQALSIA